MVLTFSISKLNTRETFKLSITNNDDFTTSMKIRGTKKYIYVYNQRPIAMQWHVMKKKKKMDKTQVPLYTTVNAKSFQLKCLHKTQTTQF